MNGCPQINFSDHLFFFWNPEKLKPQNGEWITHFMLLRSEEVRKEYETVVKPVMKVSFHE
jgi:hypothetical protein